jgi:TolB-like protein
MSAIEAALSRSGARVFPSNSYGIEQPTYVVETLVQRSGDRARVNVRLIDPNPSVPVWANQLDFSVDSVFVAQDSIAARVTAALAQALARRRSS